MKNLFEASPAALSLIQLIAGLGTLVGLWFFEFNITNIVLILLGYFLYSGIGLGMMYHRYWTHKSFEFKSIPLMWIFTWFGIVAGRGSIIGWVHVHREHHAYSDTDKDPHSPKVYGWKLNFPILINFVGKFNKYLVRDLLTNPQIKINQYYLLFVIGWIVLLSLIDLQLAYFGWFVPITLTHLVWNSFNYIGHKYGYRNFDTKDTSCNFWPAGYLNWGEGWHNNHHHNAKSWTNKIKWWEVDMISWIIRIVKK